MSKKSSNPIILSDFDNFKKFYFMGKKQLEKGLTLDETTTQQNIPKTLTLLECATAYKQALGLFLKCEQIQLSKDFHLQSMPYRTKIETYKSLMTPRMSKILSILESRAKTQKAASQSRLGQHTNSTSTGNNDQQRDEDGALSPRTQISDEDLAAHFPHIPPNLISSIASNIVSHFKIKWEDVVGMPVAKTALIESVIFPLVNPELFSGVLSPAPGILLYGPPGTGKTFISKAVASLSSATFFQISASSLTSKYLGEAEKLVKALFEISTFYAPSIVFIDEIDALMTQRGGSSEHEASRRLKNQILIQLSEVADLPPEKRVVVIAATNLPEQLDDALLRRLPIRIYTPLPDEEARAAMIKRILKKTKSNLSPADITKLVKLTSSYSASDLTQLAKSAAFQSVRELTKDRSNWTSKDIVHVAKLDPTSLRPVSFDDFIKAMQIIKPSSDNKKIQTYIDWTKEFGQ